MNLTVIEKEKIRYRAERLAKAKQKFDQEEYNYAKFLTDLDNAGYVMGEYHNDKELEKLAKVVTKYERELQKEQKVSAERFALSDAVRKAKNDKRGGGPKRKRR